MGRFDERASNPDRGPGDMFKWKVLRKSDPRAPDFAEVDKIRPGIADPAPAIQLLTTTDAAACWIGHASWAFRLGGKLCVIDPVWSQRLSGVVPRLVPPGVPFEQMPPIDIVLVTHDHRDHMDLPTLARLGDAPLYIVPLGNGPRIAKLGANRNVVELDWWQTHEVGQLQITLVPARHWSMREPWNKNATLWGGFVIRGPEGTIYHSGDTAWGDHFADIGTKVGAIDWAMLPIGAYSPRWFMNTQHINAEEAGQGFEALGAKNLLAMHWGTFRLTDEPIGEPPARIRAYWAERKLDPARLWILDVGEARRL